MRGFLVFSLVAALTGLTPARAGAGQAPDDSVNPHWLPWLGCWRPADERAPEQGVLVCVVPAGTNAARMMTLAGDQAVVDETFVADGVSRAVAETGCRGTRTSDWSKSGRLFATAELTCEGQPVRRVSGLSFIAVGGDWVDIQAITTGVRETVRVRRYRRTAEFPPDASLLSPELAARAALTRDAALLVPFTLDDVIEASGKLSSGAVEAALVETQATFPLNGRTLVALDDAGVADSVIDLMVAQTFPKQFQVRRRGGGSSSGSSSGSWAGYGGVGWDWLGVDPFYDYYSPFGYSYWNRFGDYGDYYYGPGTGVIVAPWGGGASTPPGDHGRVVNGGGYTQVSPREPAVDANARGRSSGDGASSTSAGSSGGSSSDGGSSGVSSAGYSSGGGGGDGDRSAVPR